MNDIILIGYRCTGKSSIARQLGVQLSLPVYDSDWVIEQRTGKSVSGIFAEVCESGFRDIEEKTVADIVLRAAEFAGVPALILSTGGGAVLRENNRQLLQTAGTVFWLMATPETVFRRMQNDAQSRPPLTDLPPLDEIKMLIEQRYPLYAETAHHRIETDTATTTDVVRTIMDIIPGAVS